MDNPTVYLDKMTEALNRLQKSEQYLAQFVKSTSVFELESATLQLRKAMEAIAFAAIAPNKQQYAAVRKSAGKSAHFGDDWKADSIFLILDKLNPDFYPDPLLEPVQVAPMLGTMKNRAVVIWRGKDSKLYIRDLGNFCTPLWII
jgi:hypothetical protein